MWRSLEYWTGAGMAAANVTLAAVTAPIQHTTPQAINLGIVREISQRESRAGSRVFTDGYSSLSDKKPHDILVN